MKYKAGLKRGPQIARVLWHTEEGVVVAALNGEGVEVDKGGQEFAGMTTGPKGQIELKCL